ncbi:MAG TPA: TetR family transcriptional regulator, partial [Ruminococcus sp.]|nr:TetR family transcriptional regulator [Ruminococcus sp.]
EKQLCAMREAEIDFKMHSIYELVYSCVMRLIGGK